MILNRSRCKNTYFKNKTAENWETYRKLRNDCVKLTKKVKREYFQKLDINYIKDNKMFWKTIKPLFSNKGSKSTKIILVENDEIVSDDKKTGEIMNEYFVNITKDLDIPEIMLEKLPDSIDITCLVQIDQIIHQYSMHPSILKINEIVNPTDTFSFEKVNQSQMEKEIMNLNPKKAGGADFIPPNVIKHSVTVLKSSLTQFNNSVEECIFPSDLKYANVAPLSKKDDNTNKENYRPISILPSISKKQVTTYVSNKL